MPRDLLPYDAVLFDMDGLLVDSEHLWFATEHEVVASLGGTWTEEDQHNLLGNSLTQASRYIVEHTGGAASVDAVAHALVDGMALRLRDGVDLQPGARALLEALGEAGVPRALVSSSLRVLVDAVLPSLGPEHFAFSVAGDEVSRQKPDPEPYRTAAAALGVDPARCVVLEDSPTGAAAGVAAGAVVIVVPTVPGLQVPAGAHVVPSLEELDVTSLGQIVAESRRAGAARGVPPREMTA